MRILHTCRQRRQLRLMFVWPQCLVMRSNDRIPGGTKQLYLTFKCCVGDMIHTDVKIDDL